MTASEETLSPGDEKVLVERMLAGDEAAMEAFSDRYFPALYRFALRRLYGDTEMASEVVQSTVCKALAKLDGFRGEAPLFTWLCACCRNEIAMLLRGRSRFPTVELDEQAAPARLARAPTQEETLVRAEAAHQVHAALDLLPSSYARALEWKYLERLPVKEIAERLSVGPKAAESLLTRARKAFREGYGHLASAVEAASGWPGH